MTKPTDSSRSTDSGVSGNRDSSAPNSPEVTRLSGEQAEERTAREGRKDAAKEWLKSNQRDFLMRLMRADCPTLGDEIAGYMGEFAESECSRLASRVEELERTLSRIQGLLKGEWRMTEIEKQAAREIEHVLAGAHAEEKPNV